MLRKLLLSRRRPPAPVPSLPPGTRVYAVGDVHGRRDLLDLLLTQIDADDDARMPAETLIIFLGDLVDRGPDSAGVVERLRRLAEERTGIHLLMGNHEELLLAALTGDAKATRLFCRVGGRETALSYGLDEAAYDAMNYAELGAWLATAVPPEHRAFLDTFEDLVVLGDYAFVHAGVRPGIELAAQRRSDLRWIREPFLDHSDPFERMIVHGHTIVDQVVRRANRIGIDTGAYATGRLTALALEGDRSWELATAAKMPAQAAE